MTEKFQKIFELFTTKIVHRIFIYLNHGYIDRKYIVKF